MSWCSEARGFNYYGIRAVNMSTTKPPTVNAYIANACLIHNNSHARPLLGSRPSCPYGNCLTSCRTLSKGTQQILFQSLLFLCLLITLEHQQVPISLCRLIHSLRGILANYIPRPIVSTPAKAIALLLYAHTRHLASEIRIRVTHRSS